MHCFTHLPSLTLNPLAPPPFFQTLSEGSVGIYSHRDIFPQLQLPILQRKQREVYLLFVDVLILILRMGDCKTAVVFKLILPL